MHNPELSNIQTVLLPTVYCDIYGYNYGNILTYTTPSQLYDKSRI